MEQKETIEETILGIEQEVFTAIRRKDIPSLRRFLADDFVYRTPDGAESGKEDFLRSIEGTPVEVSAISGEQQRVSIFGEVAVLTGVQRAEWRQEDVTEGVNKVAFADVFAWREGRWLMALAYGVELPR